MVKSVSFAEAIRVYTQRPLIAMALLGFAAGLPNLLVADTLSAWLREDGIELKAIALFSLVGLAYSFKVLWAPFVDRLTIPGLSRLMGKRRSWMLVCQALIIGLLLTVAGTGASGNLALTALLAVSVAFTSATQDIVIDAWRIEAAEDRLQGSMAAVYQAGYRLAIIVAGALPLLLAEPLGWPGAYALMAGLMAVGLLGTLLAPVPEGDIKTERVQLSVRAFLLDPLADFFRRYGWMAVALLAVICLYRLTDFTLTIMNPFYLDLGFSKTEIAEVRKVFGVIASMVGVFTGGVLITRYGIRWPFFWGAVGSAVTNLLFFWLATQGHSLPALFVTIGIDNFFSGFAGACLIAFMSSLVNHKHTATQYALLSSVYSLPGKLLGGASGAIVEGVARHLPASYLMLFPTLGGPSLAEGAAKVGVAPTALLGGYGVFFLYTFALGVPAVIIAWWLAVRGPLNTSKTTSDTAA